MSNSIKFNAEDKAKTEIAHKRLVALGYQVLSSGWNSVVVRIGEQIWQVKHSDCDQFVAAHPVN